MKRSEALQPLSRDHHQALRVAQRMRRAPRTEEAAGIFLEFWKEGGAKHFQIEEAVLLPLWGLLGTVDDEAATRLSREHLAIRSAALAVEAHETSRDLLRNLADAVSAHVRFEERELFPLIEEDLASEDLDRLARAVAEAER